MHLSKKFLCLLLAMVASTSHAQSGQTAYDFAFKKLHGAGAPLPLSDYRGKVLLVVNTASQCGFTPQFTDLETLYQTYSPRGLVIIGIPSNNFGGQEPGSEADIEQVCRYNYGVTFPMAQKEDVAGKNAHPFYKWIPSQLGFGSAPKWNFHKYLIGRDGKPVNFYLSTTAPLSSTLKDVIETELAKAAPVK